MLMQMQDMTPRPAVSTVSTPSAYEEADEETTVGSADPDNGATSLVSTTTVTGGSGASMVTSANIDTMVTTTRLDSVNMWVTTLSPLTAEQPGPATTAGVLAAAVTEGSVLTAEDGEYAGPHSSTANHNNPSSFDADSYTPWPLGEEINLKTVADNDLRFIIKTNMPNIDDMRMEQILNNLRQHGGTINVSALDDILRRINHTDESKTTPTGTVDNNLATENRNSTTIRPVNIQTDDPPSTFDTSAQNTANTGAGVPPERAVTVGDVALSGADQQSASPDQTEEGDSSSSSDPGPGSGPTPGETLAGGAAPEAGDTNTDTPITRLAGAGPARDQHTQQLGTNDEDETEISGEATKIDDIHDKSDEKKPYFDETTATSTETSNNFIQISTEKEMDDVGKNNLDQPAEGKVNSDQEQDNRFKEGRIEQEQEVTPNILQIIENGTSVTSFGADSQEEDEVECYRRYMSRPDKPDISYYNTTVRTRLLTAICLEGIRCPPELDSSRCGLLHRKCNEHVDTRGLSLAMRVTLSECTLEDILCHLGHTTAVMCCQDKYSQCVHHLQDLQTNNEVDNNAHAKDGHDERTQFDDIISQITGQVFNNEGNTIEFQNVDASSIDINNKDNETLHIFQDFVVVVNDPKNISHTLLSQEDTNSSILTNLFSNSSDFRIIFDPNSTYISGGDGTPVIQNGDNDAELIQRIKDQVNKAVTNTAKICSNKICITNLSNITTDNENVNENKNDSLSILESQLKQCIEAEKCTDSMSCIFAQTRCLQLSNINILPTEARRDVTLCKIESLKCLLESESVMGEDKCMATFQRCTAQLGVDTNRGAIMNFVPHAQTESSGNQNEVLENGASGTSGILLETILNTLMESLEEDIGQDLRVEFVPVNNDTQHHPDTINIDLNDFNSDLLETIKNKLNETKEPVKIIAKQDHSENFKMNLPDFGISISVKEDLSNTSFGMSLPEFGFNITVDKDPSQCSLGSQIYDDFEQIPNEDPCKLCTCSAGNIECFTQACTPPDNLTDCQPQPTPGSCCPKYECGHQETTAATPVSGREDISIFSTEDMLAKVKDSIISVLNNTAEVYLKTTPPSITQINLIKDKDNDDTDTTSEAAETITKMNDYPNQKDDQVSISHSESDQRESTDSPQPDTDHQSNKTMDKTLDTNSVIGDRNVKVFLNFTWMDETFIVEEDFTNTEFSQNLTDKIKEKLSSGVGYVIVPEGRKPEMNDEKTVHLIQTVNIDQNGSVDIETSIQNVVPSNYSDFDNSFIKKVENKTLQVAADIFEEMQNNLTATTTESLYSTNIQAVFVTKPTTIHSETVIDREESYFTTEKNWHSKDKDMKSPKEIILIFLNDQQKISEEKENVEKLLKEIEKSTQLQTFLVEEESEIDLLKKENNVSVYLLQQTSKTDMSFSIDKNNIPINLLEGEEKEKATKILEIANSKLDSLPPPLDSTTDNNSKNVVNQEEDLEQIPIDLFNSFSDVDGLTLLNQTAVAGNDTIVIYQDILLNPEQFSNFSQIFNTEDGLTQAAIPDDIKDQILSAFNQSNLYPLDNEAVRDSSNENGQNNLHNRINITEGNVTDTSNNVNKEHDEKEQTDHGGLDKLQVSNQEFDKDGDQHKNSNEDEEAKELQNNINASVDEASKNNVDHIQQNEQKESNDMTDAKKLSDSEEQVISDSTDLGILKTNEGNNNEDPQTLNQVGNDGQDSENSEEIKQISNMNGDKGQDTQLSGNVHVVPQEINEGNESDASESATNKTITNENNIDGSTNNPEDKSPGIESIEDQQDINNGDNIATTLKSLLNPNGSKNQDHLNEVNEEDQETKTNDNVNKVEEPSIIEDEESMKPINIFSEKSNDLNENQNYDDRETTIQPLSGINQPSEDDTQDTLPVRVNFNFEDNKTGSADDKINDPGTEQQQHSNDKVNSTIRIDNLQNGKDNDRNNNLITSTTILPILDSDQTDKEDIIGTVPVSVNFNFEDQEQDNMNKILIILPPDLHEKVMANRDEIVPQILNAVKIPEGDIFEVDFFRDSDNLDEVHTADTVTIDYSNCSVTFNNADLKYLPPPRIESTLRVFDEVDTALKNAVENFFTSEMLCLENMANLDEKVELTNEPIQDSDPSVILSIKTKNNVKSDEVEILQSNLENNFQEEISILMNEKPEVIRNIQLRNSSLLLQIDTTREDEKLNSFDRNLNDSNLSQETKEKLMMEIQSFVDNLNDEDNETFQNDGANDYSLNSSEVLKRPTASRKPNPIGRITNILADLLIKTINLSFTIKGAIDKKSENNQNIEFSIISRKDETENPIEDDWKSKVTDIPDLIKITSDDAMFIHQNKEKENVDSQSENKTIVIELVNHEGYSFNASDGMVFEIDLSNLPLDPFDKEKEIRNRVENFINGIDLMQVNSGKININEDIVSSSLSDDIIKNITQIVLLEMNKVFQNQSDKENNFQKIFSVTQRTPFFDNSQPTTVDQFEEKNEILDASFPTFSSTSGILPEYPILSTTSRISASSSVLSAGKASTPNNDYIVPKNREEVTSSVSYTTQKSEDDLNLKLDRMQNDTATDDTIVTSAYQEITTISSLATTLSTTTTTTQNYEDESNQVINEVKNTITSVIKDVLSEEKNTQSRNDLENIVQKIRNNVPNDVKLKTSMIDDEELQTRIKETVGKILTNEEISSIVRLRNISDINEVSSLPSGDITGSVSVSENQTDSISIESTTITQIVKKYTTDSSVTTSSTSKYTSTEDNANKQQNVTTEKYGVNTIQPFVNAETTSSTQNSLEGNLFENTYNFVIIFVFCLGDNIDDGIVLNLKEFTVAPNTEEFLTDNLENEIDGFFPASESETNEAQNIIQDGNLFAESFNTGVVKAKVVEDTSYARSIKPAHFGVAAILSIVIGVLATLCFSFLIILAMRRKRNSAVELAPSSTGGYTNTGSRYSPDNSSADISDMKATYVEELSPNVSSSDIHPQEVLVPMDGHLTIVGSYEEFLDVPTGARPNLLQCLPVSPTMHTETVTRTVEMTDPELAFTPSERQT